MWPGCTIGRRRDPERTSAREPARMFEQGRWQGKALPRSTDEALEVSDERYVAQTISDAMTTRHEAPADD